MNTHREEMKIIEKKYTVDEYKEMAPESYHNMINYFNSSIWYSWKYNEIIGWICLKVMGSQIRGDYYFIVKKRIGKGIKKKRFINLGKAFEYFLSNNLSSTEIFKEIISKLELLNKNERPFKNRYIDLETFKTIGKFVDWKLLVNTINSFDYPKSNL